MFLESKVVAELAVLLDCQALAENKASPANQVQLVRRVNRATPELRVTQELAALKVPLANQASPDVLVLQALRVLAVQREWDCQVLLDALELTVNLVNRVNRVLVESWVLLDPPVPLDRPVSPACPAAAALKVLLADLDQPALRVHQVLVVLKERQVPPVSKVVTDALGNLEARARWVLKVNAVSTGSRVNLAALVNGVLAALRDLLVLASQVPEVKRVSRALAVSAALLDPLVLLAKLRMFLLSPAQGVLLVTLAALVNQAKMEPQVYADRKVRAELWVLQVVKDPLVSPVCLARRVIVEITEKKVNPERTALVSRANEERLVSPVHQVKTVDPDLKDCQELPALQAHLVCQAREAAAASEAPLVWEVRRVTPVRLVPAVLAALLVAQETTDPRVQLVPRVSQALSVARVDKVLLDPLARPALLVEITEIAIPTNAEPTTAIAINFA